MRVESCEQSLYRPISPTVNRYKNFCTEQHTSQLTQLRKSICFIKTMTSNRQTNYTAIFDKILAEHARPKDPKSKVVVFLTRIANVEAKLSRASGPQIDYIIGKRVEFWSCNPPSNLQPTKGSHLWMCAFYLAFVAEKRWESPEKLAELVKE